MLLDGGIVNRKNERCQGELLMKTKSIAGSQWYRNIFSLPSDPAKEFILDGCTYEEIYRLAAGIRCLQPSGEKDRAIICLCTGDKALIAAALVASLAGGPRLVLPYAFSRQALEEVLATMSVSFLLADRSCDFPSGPEVITPTMLRRDSTIHDTFIDPDEPFLMLFTGGSTGKPKVWSKTPRNMLSEARHMSGKFGISPDDLFLSTVPPQHIYGFLFSVLIPFISSARVLDEVYTFPREILRAAKDYGASILVSIPVHYRVLKTDDLQRHDLRMAFSSAGVLDKKDAAYFHDKTGLDIVEIYGSTETGGVAARRRLRDGESWRALDPVNWKIRNGRLHVRSEFISPALPRDAAGFFLTADCADFDGHDRFVLLGRADDIIKIGGKRVDLASVQAKLKQIPGVHDAVVVSIPTGNGRQNELAALVATHLDVHQLRQHIATVSEDYAVPKHITVVKEIPVTTTGKYNRAKIERILRSGKQKAVMTEKSNP
jgi:acyl-coenzyme A synthetase/AMP-(fatty) acid ligase